MTIQTSRLQIKGMTCQSCVNNIEKTIGDLKGVHSIIVNLATEEGTVIHDVDFINGGQLAERVDDMGFECVLHGENNTGATNQIPPSSVDNILVADLLGEPIDCACGDKVIEISVKG